jgi:YjjI family glycine radical enzyme
LEAPRDLDETISFLTILYGHVPSITGYPVYLGNIDTLLEPFAGAFDDQTLDRKLKLFWRAVDRLLPNGFVHANVGPRDTRVGRAILRLERELRQVVPNISLKVDPECTSDEFILEGVKTALCVAKPHFVNHRMMVRDLGEDYGIASCYNSLRVGGGAHTLVRLNLKASVQEHEGRTEEFWESTLAAHVEATSEVLSARIRHVVEGCRFFEHHFLAQEGLISLDRFSAMFGIFGLAEAVNTLLERDGISEKYGVTSEAKTLAIRIVSRLAELVRRRELPYCKGNGGRALLHSQSGIDDDIGITPGTRIPFADEPSLFDNIL